MARAHPGETPGQLSLDDWAETLEASTEPVAAEPHPPPPPAASRHHQSTRELLDTPGALLTRTHLRKLGLERRAVDAVFRALPVVALPGYSRPMIRAEQYLDLLAHCTL